MRILVSGSLGFIASHLVDKLVDLGHEVHGLDGLFTGSDVRNANQKATYHIIDLCNKQKLEELFKKHQFDQIYHLAAESHVDRAIKNGQSFIDSNITGTYNLFECVKIYNCNVRFLLFSTDELMGELDHGSFKEGDECKPKNLYSMTKQAQEAIARSYFHSDNIQVVTTRCSNIYGPRQYPEKLLPVIIKSILTNQQIPVYGTGTNCREWTFISDAVEAAIFVMAHGNLNEVYHIGSGIEKTNIDVINFVLSEMNADRKLIKYVEDRKGHDLRYSLCVDKVNKMGWKAKVNFEDGFRRTIEWYKNNQRWE